MDRHLHRCRTGGEGILGSIDLLGRPSLNEEKRQRYLGSIKETAERAAKLTSQLLAFARRQPLKAEHFDVGEQLRLGEDVLRTVSGSSVAIDLQIECEPCFVDADPPSIP
jgi:signal transduction histidine kinase